MKRLSRPGGLIAVAAVCVLAGVVGWIVHLRSLSVAPELKTAMVGTIQSPHRHVTLIGGGSRRDAHRLWDRYHDGPAHGTPPKSPRLLGISLAKVSGEGMSGTGTFWVVYLDRVWMRPMIGSGNSFGREVVFVDPSSLRQVGAEEGL